MKAAARRKLKIYVYWCHWGSDPWLLQPNSSGWPHSYSGEVDLKKCARWNRFLDKYCKCSHNSLQSKVPWSQLQLLSTKSATDAWFWECAFPSRFCSKPDGNHYVPPLRWFMYMGKVHVMSTDPLGSCKELTNKTMQSIDTCWWLDVFLTMLCAQNVPNTDAFMQHPSFLQVCEESEMKVMWYASISSETPPSGQCSFSPWQFTEQFAGKLL